MLLDLLSAILLAANAELDQLRMLVGQRSAGPRSG
jgi:hypothetical protein